MPTTQPDEPALQQIEEQAYRWLRGGCDFDVPEVFAAFRAWLRADLRHRDAFIRVSLSRHAEHPVSQVSKVGEPEALPMPAARRRGIAVTTVMLLGAGVVGFFVARN